MVSTWLQCDHPGCLKWRIVPDLPGIVPEADEPWYCELNRDPARNTCEAAQQPDDAMLDEAVLALLAEAEPDQDVDELGGLPPTPSLPPTAAAADAPASAADAAPPSAGKEAADPSASPSEAAPSGRRSSGRAKAEGSAPAPAPPPEPPTKAGQKGQKGQKDKGDKEGAAAAQPKPPKPKPKAVAPVPMTRVEVALGEGDMASWYQARRYGCTY